MGSGVGGEGGGGEVSREMMQTQRKCRGVAQTTLIEGPKSMRKGISKSSLTTSDRDGRHRQCLKMRSLTFTW